jgi:branched-chain amino acid transport system substrate-binding protein
MKCHARTVLLPILAVVAAAAVGPTACSPTTSGDGAATDGGAEGAVGGDVIIGFSNSLTGGLTGLGTPLNDAARVAEQQVNQVGVLGGRHIHIEVFDDLSDSTTGAPNAAQHFIGENVPAVLGPLSSPECLAVDQTYAAHKIVEISPSATSTLLTNAQPATDRYFFRTAPSDFYQGQAVAKLIYDGVTPDATSDAGAPASDAGADGGAPAGTMVGGGCRNAYLVNANDDYGNGLMKVVHDTFLTHSDATIAGSLTVSTTLAPDYKNETAKVVSANPQCLVLVVYSDVGAQFMRDLRTAMNAQCTSSGCPPLAFPVYGSDGEYDSQFIPRGESNQGDLTSPNVTQSVMGTTPDPAPATPQFQIFRTVWQSSFPGQQPPAYGANLYDAILVLALAIHQAGTATDGQAIRDALFKVTAVGPATYGPDQFVDAENAISNGLPIKYLGASGPMTFNQYGDVQGDYIVWRVDKQKNGTVAFDTVGSIPSSQL